MKKTTKRPIRKKSTKRTYTTNKKRQWDKRWRLFYEKIGKLSLFLLVVIGLGALLLYRLNSVNISYQEDNGISVAEKEAFITTLVPVAQKLQRQYGVFASVSLAQAILESNYGQSQLGAVYHNLYGVKTSADDPDGVDLETQEFVDGEWVTITDRFKVYPDWEASMTKHAELIYYGTTWDPHYYKVVLDGKTYQEQAKGLQSAGYATDPTYADKLIQMIDEWHLDQYDQPTQTTNE